MIAVKKAKGVANTAVALRLMAELAGKQLALEEEQAEAADDCLDIERAGRLTRGI